MSPSEHGEVFVLDDGSEVDMDLGNYERFLDVELTGDNSITAGQIYQYVIAKERRGDYLGKTVQVIPHITDAVQEWIERVAMMPIDGKEGPPDVCIIELGGTIGDIESRPFIEALRQFSYRAGPNNFCLVHISLVPVINIVGEQKTKPTQYSVQSLRELGLTPNILACRNATPLNKNVKEKLSQFCHVPVRIAVVANYTCLSDAYLSVLESPDLHEKAWRLLKGAEGVLVPGGFGHRGVQGKILAAKYMGRAMRAGSRRTFFRTLDCTSAKLYGNVKYVDERHRHRYEVNPDMVEELENAGVKFVGMDETGDRMEFHPDFKSRPGKPSPLFMGFIAASSGQLDALSQNLGPQNGRPIPMKEMSGSSGSSYSSGSASSVEEGLLGLHISGAALAH